jgi:rRNA maturation endonuclease Nob1
MTVTITCPFCDITMDLDPYEHKRCPNCGHNIESLLDEEAILEFLEQ